MLKLRYFKFMRIFPKNNHRKMCSKNKDESKSAVEVRNFKEKKSYLKIYLF